jgi:triphosphatase
VDEEQQPVETELKLAFPAEALAAIERHPALVDEATQTIAQRAVYYDTPDLALSAAGFSLRVRRNDDALVQTLKRDGEGGGVAKARGEWEWEISGETPDTSLLNATPAAEFSQTELQPAFEVKVTRVVRQLELPGGTAVELALDEGQITALKAEQALRALCQDIWAVDGRIAALEDVVDLRITVDERVPFPSVFEVR